MERYVKDILKKAKSKKERVIRRKFLTNVCNYEKILPNELTKTSIKPIEVKWEERNKIETFYSWI